MTEKKTTVKKTTRKNKPGAGRPSFVEDFLKDKDKCKHLENYAMFRSSKTQVAEIFGTSVDTILRIVKKYTLKTYKNEMTYEQFVKFKFEQKGSSFLNTIIQKAQEGRSDKLMIYVAENIFRLNDKFKPEEKEDESSNSKGIVYLPVTAMNIDDINKSAQESQISLQEKINKQIKEEELKDKQND